jgi:ATP-binding cassette subfamily B protein
MKKETKTIGISHVLSAYWQGVKPQKGLVLFNIFAYTAGNILLIIIPLFYKRFFDLLTTSTVDHAIALSLARIILVIFIINVVALFVLRSGYFTLNSLESKTMARLKQISFDYMINHSYSFFTNNFTGSLTQRVNRFSRSFERIYDTLVFQIIPLSITISGALVVVWLQKPLIAKIMMGWLVFTMLFNFIFSRWKLKYDVASAKADTATTAVLADDMTNQNAIILFNNFKKESELFAETSNDQARAQRRAWDLAGIADSIQILLMAAVEFAVFYYAIKYWEVGAITIGTFVLIQSYIIGLSQKLWDFGRIIRNLHEAFADSKEMVEILLKPHGVQNLPDAKTLDVSKGTIKFENVLFNFNETRTVLQNLNLEIVGGEKVALIGPSGAGKSTII